MSLKELLLEKICTGISSVEYIKVMDVTHKHANHLPDNTTETHFNVAIISDSFSHLSLVKRHRIIYQLLNFELTHKIHALSLSLYTIGEYRNEKGYASNKGRIGI